MKNQLVVSEDLSVAPFVSRPPGFAYIAAGVHLPHSAFSPIEQCVRHHAKSTPQGQETQGTLTVRPVYPLRGQEFSETT